MPSAAGMDAAKPAIYGSREARLVTSWPESLARSNRTPWFVHAG